MEKFEPNQTINDAAEAHDKKFADDPLHEVHWWWTTERVPEAFASYRSPDLGTLVYRVGATCHCKAHWGKPETEWVTRRVHVEGRLRVMPVPRILADGDLARYTRRHYGSND